MQDSQSALNEALAALAANRPAEAAERLRSQAEQDAENALVHAALGMVLAQMGDAPGAIEALDRAHYLQPQNAQVLYHYGLALETTGRGRQARLRYEAALRLDPGFEPARLRMELVDQAAASALAIPAAPAIPATSQIERSHAPQPGTSLRLPVQGEMGMGEAPTAAPRPRREPSRSQPLPELPSRRMQADVSTWDAPELPGFSSLCRAALQLWGTQQLLWLGLFALPNAAAAVAIPAFSLTGWAAALAWSLALGLGLAPVLLAMAGQWMEGRPFAGEGRFTGSRWAYGTLLALGYVLVVIAPLASVLALRVPFSAGGLALGAILLTIPFHALLAPALMLTVTGQQKPARALGSALQIASRRTWLHLALMLTMTLIAGGMLAAIAWAYVVTLKGGGMIVERTLEAAGVALGESLFAGLVTVTGLDALSARPPGDLQPEDEPSEADYPESPVSAAHRASDPLRRAEVPLSDPASSAS